MLDQQGVQIPPQARGASTVGRFSRTRWCSSSRVVRDVETSQLVDRCKKLASLNITNNSRNPGKLNIMTVVNRAIESLKRLEVDHSMAERTPTAMA